MSSPPDPTMDALQRLNELEASRAVSLGLHRKQAGDYWAHNSAIGRIAHVALVGLVGVVVYLAVAVGWKLALAALVGIGIYVKGIERAGLTAVRLRLLSDEALFERFYEGGTVTIRVAATGVVIRFPTDWRAALRAL